MATWPLVGVNMKLLQTHNITFTRHGSDTDKVYVDEYGNAAQPVTESLIDTVGSLQPFSGKDLRIPLEIGVRENIYWIYYTLANLRTTDEFENLLPDTCEIKGKKYKVTRFGDWDDFKLDGRSMYASNNEYYLQLIQPKGS